MTSSQPEPLRTGFRYKAFISYSHQSDGVFASVLQRVLEKLAKPWYRRRAIDLFRDETDLAVNPELWPRIVEALDSSEYLLLLASSKAAQSHWVAKEVEHWRSNRDSAKLVVALTDGEIVWDEAKHDFDWRLTNGIPEALAGCFVSEPLWADFRAARAGMKDAGAFREPAIRLAAALRGVPPRELESEDLRQHRRTIRLAGATITMLLVLLAVAIGVSVYAFHERDLAVARQLAAHAELLLNESDSRTEQSTLLALESMRRAALLENRRVLGQTLRLLLPPASMLPRPDSAIATAMSPDARYMATASADHVLHLLDTSSDKEVVKFVTGGEVSALAFSPDSRLITVGHTDGAIRAWQLSGTQSYQLSLHDRVKALAFSPNGELLGAASENGLLAIWDVRGGKQSSKVLPQFAVNRFAFSPDGTRVALAGYRGALLLLETATGKQLWGWHFGGEVNVIAFSPDGRYVGVGSGDSIKGEADLLDTRNGTVAWRARHAGGVVALAFNREGSLVSTGGWDDLAQVVEVGSGKLIAGLAHADAVFDVAFSPDGRYLASAGRDGTTRLLDISRGVEVSRLEHGGSSVCFSPNGDNLLTVGADSSAHIYRVAPWNEVSRISFSSAVFAVSFSSSGSRVAIGMEDGLHVFDAASGKAMTLAAQGHEVQSVAFGAGDKYVGAGGLKEAWVFETASGHELCHIHIKDENFVTSTALSADGRYIATGGSKEQARMFDVSTGNEIARIAVQGLSRVVALSRDGRLLAAAGNRGETVIMDTTTKTVVSQLDKAGSVSRLAFSPNDRYLATGGWDNIARVFEARTGKQVRQFVHTQPLTALSFNSDGTFLITGSQEELARQGQHVVVRLFSMKDGEESAHVSVPGRLADVFLQPDGSALFTISGLFGSGVLSVERYPLLAKELLNTGCALVTRNLSCQEWRQYLGSKSYQGTCPNLPLPLCR